jgi:hypothetical protein
MMKHVLIFLIVTMTTVCLMGCSTKPQTLSTEALAGISNPSIHIMVSEAQKPPVTGSFGWGYSLLKVPPNAGTSLSLINKRLHSAMHDELTAKGLIFIESEPRLLVSYAVAAGSEIDADELNRTYGEMLDTTLLKMETQMHYKRGVLVLDVVERVSGTLLWRGAIMAEIDINWPEERKQERCNDAVKALLRHYPQPSPVDR